MNRPWCVNRLILRKQIIVGKIVVVMNDTLFMGAGLMIKRMQHRTIAVQGSVKQRNTENS